MLCTSITASTVEEALSTIEAGNTSGADLLELRLDFYRDFDVQQHLKLLMAACKLPYIVTFRPDWEGCAVLHVQGLRARRFRWAAQGTGGSGPPFRVAPPISRSVFGGRAQSGQRRLCRKRKLPMSMACCSCAVCCGC